MRRVGEENTERSISIDVEGSNESATEDPAAVESEEKELGTSKVSAAAKRRFSGGAVAGIPPGPHLKLEETLQKP